MTNDYRKGWRYRMATDRNFRARKRHGAKIAAARRRYVKPGARCQSQARTPHRGPLELHHVHGDLSGRSGYRVFCRFHNRAASGVKRSGPGTRGKPGGRRL